jgi:hypothetical protein
MAYNGWLPFAALVAFALCSLASAQSVLQYHGNDYKNGFYIDPLFNATNINTIALDPSFNVSVPGPVYAQVLYLVNGSRGRDVIFVATEQNQVRKVAKTQKVLHKSLLKSSMHYMNQGRVHRRCNWSMGARGGTSSVRHQAEGEKKVAQIVVHRKAFLSLGCTITRDVMFATTEQSQVRRKWFGLSMTKRVFSAKCSSV